MPQCCEPERHGCPGRGKARQRASLAEPPDLGGLSDDQRKANAHADRRRCGASPEPRPVTLGKWRRVAYVRVVGFTKITESRRQAMEDSANAGL